MVKGLVQYYYVITQALFATLPFNKGYSITKFSFTSTFGIKNEGKEQKNDAKDGRCQLRLFFNPFLFKPNESTQCAKFESITVI